MDKEQVYNDAVRCTDVIKDQCFRYIKDRDEQVAKHQRDLDTKEFTDDPSAMLRSFMTKILRGKQRMKLIASKLCVTDKEVLYQALDKIESFDVRMGSPTTPVFYLTTKPVELIYVAPNGTVTRVPMGTYRFRFRRDFTPVHGNGVECSVESIGGRSRRACIHPHINDTVCWGTYQGAIERALATIDIASLIHYTVDFINSFYSGDWYIAVPHFMTDEEFSKSGLACTEGCGTENGCECERRCGECDRLEEDCECGRCDGCGNYDCTCQNCCECDRYYEDCTCDDCPSCGEQPYYCEC